jgi:hypothetical protein
VGTQAGQRRPWPGQQRSWAGQRHPWPGQQRSWAGRLRASPRRSRPPQASCRGPSSSDPPCLQVPAPRCCTRPRAPRRRARTPRNGAWARGGAWAGRADGGPGRCSRAKRIAGGRRVCDPDHQGSSPVGLPPTTAPAMARPHSGWRKARARPCSWPDPNGSGVMDHGRPDRGHPALRVVQARLPRGLRRHAPPGFESGHFASSVVRRRHSLDISGPGVPWLTWPKATPVRTWPPAPGRTARGASTWASADDTAATLPLQPATDGPRGLREGRGTIQP